MQLFTDNIPDSGDQYGTDLTNMKNNFAALKSMFSGTSAPSNTVEGMMWLDMNANKAWKVRDKTNANWLGMMVADVLHKIWVYRNTAPEGWAIDATVTDCVIALKGGSLAYNSNGGTQVGSWTIPGHALSEAEMPAHDHGSDGSHVHDILVTDGGSWLANVQLTSPAPSAWGGGYIDSAGAHSHASKGSGSSHDHGSTYRPAAAVGTLQYLNI